MTATERLRRMLDERGVEWETDRSGFRVMWGKPLDEFHDTMQFKAVNNALPNGGLNVHICGFTPEQAIAATLGRGTCHNIAVPDEYSDRPFTCSECGARGPMGNGTYHMASSWAMEDGTLAFADSWPVWKYCPNCGRRVVDPTADGADAEVTDD